MIYGKSWWTAALMALAASGGTFAAAPSVFLTPSQYDPARLLPPPPSDNSTGAKTELAELKQIETARSAAQLARAKSDDKTQNASIFAEIIGPGFDLGTLPATAKMFADIRREEQVAANAAKDFFKRNRPWIVDPSVASCSKEDAPQSSYPSGHATMGYSMGVVLASLAPEKAQAILARANDYAENRLVCGMHFRRDIEAGQALGTAIAVELMHNPRFQADYDAAAMELRAAHLTMR
jgi:acid phosphatase (class A)